MIKYLKSIWFWWLLLTLIYSVLYFTDVWFFDIHHYIYGLVGLFVPFGPLAVMWAFITLPYSLISIFVFLFSAYFFQKWLKDSGFGTIASIIVILITLIIITIVVDINRGTPLASWQIFLTGDIDKMGY